MFIIHIKKLLRIFVENKIMQNTFELKESENKDHYHMVINGSRMGEWDTDDLRHFMECIDNRLPWRQKNAPNKVQ